MTPTLLVFAAGLAGSVHCVAMCGGYVCALGPGRGGPAAQLARHLAYHLGRIASYAFIGALVGAAGVEICGRSPVQDAVAPRVLALVSGLLMLAFGLQFLGLLPRLHALPGGALAGVLRRLMRAPGPAAPLALGAINGWLPCPLVYAFAAQAVASGGPLPGAALMLCFGLGTVPALLATGGFGIWLRRRAAWQPVAMPATAGANTAAWRVWRVQGVRLAGAFIVGLALLTMARGWLPLWPHVGH